MREIKKFPSKPDYLLKKRADNNFPTYDTFTRKFNNKAGIAQKLVDYCQEKEEFEDIIELALPYCESTTTRPKETDTKGNEKFGYVYLLKSGKFYKIGRSDAVDRRAYEVGLKMPTKTEKVHEIKTDDPIGVEHYWHERFKEKRTNGEWFDLNPKDVKAFKKWKRIC